MAVRGADHVLLDDRALVEVGGRVVGGGADQLHAALVGLVIGPPPAEGRQEGVVDVDHGPPELREELLREHLHVAGEHDEVDALLAQQRELALLLLALVLLPDREDAIGDPELPRDPLEIRVVAHDQRDLAAELPGLVAQEQVVEAVVGARDEDRHAFHVIRPGEAPGHREARGDLGERALERQAVGEQLGDVEVDALEEEARLRVGVLVGLEDVGAVPVKDLGQRGDDPAAVGAADEQRRGLGGARGHGRSSLAGFAVEGPQGVR
jgi:hypothetical protein